MLDITGNRVIEKPGTNACFYEEHKWDFIYCYDDKHMKLKQRWNKYEKISRAVKIQSEANIQDRKIRNRSKNQNAYGRR